METRRDWLQKGEARRNPLYLSGFVRITLFVIILRVYLPVAADTPMRPSAMLNFFAQNYRPEGSRNAVKYLHVLSKHSLWTPLTLLQTSEGNLFASTSGPSSNSSKLVKSDPIERRDLTSSPSRKNDHIVAEVLQDEKENSEDMLLRIKEEISSSAWEFNVYY